jgi:hypothetical protein
MVHMRKKIKSYTTFMQTYPKETIKEEQIAPGVPNPATPKRYILSYSVISSS